MPETPEDAQPQEAPQPPPDAVLVPVSYGEDGSVSVEVQRLGSVRTTELATILEQALRITRAQLGLEG